MAATVMIRQFCFRLGVTVILVTVLGVGGGPALAAGGSDEDLIRQGVESRRKQNDAEALEFFRRAYQLNPSPRAAAQMGWAEIALGRWVDATGHLEEAVAGSSDPWVAKHLATIKESLDRARQRVGELEILGGPPRATIAIEGVVVGTLPLAKPIRVRSGDCRFVVSSPGYETLARTVDVAAGQLTRETVNLSKVAASAQAPSGAGVSAGQVTAAATDAARVAARETRTGESTGVTETAPPVEQADGNQLPTIGVILASAGLVSVGAGVFFSIKTHSAGEEASKSPMFDPSADSAAHRYQTLQYVAYGVGAALIAAGVTTYVLGINRRDGGNQAQVAVVPSTGGASAILMGRF